MCKSTFLATLGICKGWIQKALQKLEEGAHISADKRGKNSSGGHQVDPRLKGWVRKHIEGFPRMPSHYVREASTKEYLYDEVHNVADLHDIFKA